MTSLSKLINIGDKIQVKEIDEQRTNLYVSQIADIKKDNIIEILFPMFKNNIASVSDNQTLKLIITKQEAVYEFMAIVVGIRYDNVPLLKLKAISEPKKIQRRNFYRLKIVKPIRYKMIDTSISSEKSNEYFEGILLDISEGGIMFCAKKEMALNDLLELEISLEIDKIIQLKGKIVRKLYNISKSFLYEYGVKYHNITRTDKDILMKFIFQEQRKLLKRGFL